MGVINWFRRHKTKGSRVVGSIFSGSAKKRNSNVSLDKKGKEVVSMIEELIEKAKKYYGDAFYEYRKKGILPERFEYGMNCFLDRIAESQGIEIADKSYQEFKKISGCLIVEEDTTWTDIAGIPILFGIKGKLTELIEVHNIAINFLEPETVPKSLEDIPTFLQKLKNETESEYIYRLAATTTAFLARGEIFYEEGKTLEAKNLLLYVQLINKIILSMPSSEKQGFGGKDDYLLVLFIGSLIPDEQSEITKFLSFVGPSFWNILFITKFATALSGWDKNVSTALDGDALHFAVRENGEVVRKWNKHIRNSDSFKTDNIFDKIWEDIKANLTNPLGEGMLSSIQISNILLAIIFYHEEDDNSLYHRLFRIRSWWEMPIKFKNLFLVAEGCFHMNILSPTYKELCMFLYKKIDLSKQLDELIKSIGPLKVEKSKKLPLSQLIGKM